MGGFFKLDSPFMNFLGKVADLLILNCLTLIMCLPIITMGASITAMFSVLLKMVRKEEPSIWKSYWASFRENFKQSTLIWLILMFVITFISYDFYMFIKDTEQTIFPQALRVGLLAVSAILSLIILYIFPLQCRFNNSIGKTLRNAMFLSISNLPKTIAIAVIYIVFVLIYLSFPQIIPVTLMLGITVPSYLAAYVFHSIFKKYEPKKEEEVDYQPLSIFSEDSSSEVEVGLDQNAGQNQEE